LPTEIGISSETLSRLEEHGFSPDGDAFNVGRPDQPTLPMRTKSGARVVVKLSRDTERAERLHRNMQLLWGSRFGRSREVPAMAEPLDYLQELGAVVMVRLEGRPLAQWGWLQEERLESSIRLLAELHESDARPTTKRGRRAILRSAERKVSRIEELDPGLKHLAGELLAGLFGWAKKERELVVSHGDFSPRNVLVNGPGLALIDWDRLQLADPARDVAYFGSYAWSEDLRRGRKPDRSALRRAVRAYHSVREGAKLERALPFHLALGCVRRAASLLELWPEERWLAGPLRRCGLRELERRP